MEVKAAGFRGGAGERSVWSCKNGRGHKRALVMRPSRKLPGKGM